MALLARLRRSPSSWDGRVVFVTGGSSGIGRAVFEALYDQGASVGLISRRGDVLRDLTADLPRASFAVADVRDRGAVAEAVSALSAQLGPPDVLVASAGIHRETPAHRADTERVAEVLDVNVMGVVHAVHAVLPAMLERASGCVAVVSSLAASSGLPGNGAYSASKAAVDKLFESYQIDLRGSGVDAVIVSPGFVDTPLITDADRASALGLVSADEAARRIVRAVERRRLRVAFPWSLRAVAVLARHLPARARMWLALRFGDLEDVRAE